MVYLKVKENTAQAKIFLEFAKTMQFVEVVQEKDLPNETTKKAIAEADKGGLKRFKTVNALMKDLKTE